MEFITSQEAADKWGVSLRWVQMYLKDGRIDGAVRFGRDWMIPKDAEQPKDGRVKHGKNMSATGTMKEGMKGQEPVPNIVALGSFIFDLVSCIVYQNGKDLGVRQKECDVLYFLAQNENTTFSVEEIYERAWGKKMIGDNRTVRATVRDLRNSLKGSGYTIFTEYSKGYYFGKENEM